MLRSCSVGNRIARVHNDCHCIGGNGQRLQPWQLRGGQPGSDREVNLSTAQHSLAQCTAHRLQLEGDMRMLPVIGVGQCQQERLRAGGTGDANVLRRRRFNLRAAAGAQQAGQQEQKCQAERGRPWRVSWSGRS